MGFNALYSERFCGVHLIAVPAITLLVMGKGMINYTRETTQCISQCFTYIICLHDDPMIPYMFHGPFNGEQYDDKFSILCYPFIANNKYLRIFESITDLGNLKRNIHKLAYFIYRKMLVKISIVIFGENHSSRKTFFTFPQSLMSVAVIYFWMMNNRRMPPSSQSHLRSRGSFIRCTKGIFRTSN